MSSAFYKSVIEDEIKVFAIKKESLKVAAVSVKKTYSSSSLKEGSTFLDYNLTSNRCAYLYKYAPIHTSLVAKYFKLLLKNKEIKSLLNKKESLKICCLGGGPGTDIVGLFKALTTNPNYQKKVVEVTVLDICGGWRNSFKRIISNLISGKVKDVPETFVDIINFKFKLIEVNLLNQLPDNVVNILSEADIVCMVKFLSAVLGSSTSMSAIQMIGEKLKVSAILLFIDNFHGKIFKPLIDIVVHTGLKIVVGPLHECFDNKNGFVKTPVTAAEKEMFKCTPCVSTKVTVLGFVKSSQSFKRELSSNSVNLPNEIKVEDDDDDNWDTDNESEGSSSKQNLGPENVAKTLCDKFTQTYEKFFTIKKSSLPAIAPDQSKVLESLIDSMSDLVCVLDEFHGKLRIRRNCCHCH